MNLLTAMTGLDQLGGAVALIVSGLLFVLAIYWVLLPFFLLSALKEVRTEVTAARKVSEQQLQLLRSLEARTQDGGGVQATNEHLKNLFDAATRTNALLDWGAQTASQHLPPAA